MSKQTAKKEISEYPGYFITFEGIEGTGKTTLVQMLHKILIEDWNLDVALVREPGTTQIGEQIRRILKKPENKEIAANAEILLFMASRAQSCSEIIIPCLKRGGIVIADRFSDSTFAYQGYAGGLNVDNLINMEHFATSKITPDLTFLIDIKNPEIGLKRKIEQGKLDRIEEKGIDFQSKVAAGYMELSRKFNRRIKIINGDQTIEKMLDDVLQHLMLLLVFMFKSKG